MGGVLLEGGSMVGGREDGLVKGDVMVVVRGGGLAIGAKE